MPDFDFDAFNHDEAHDEMSSNGASHNDELVISAGTTTMLKSR